LPEKTRVIHKPVDKEPTRNSVIVSRLPNNSSLNSEYTFENFVVGQSNQLAHAATMAVSDNLGTKYNPLYIYGNSGLGKTHLIQAIGNALSAKDPEKRVLYVTSETFVNDFIQAVSSGFGRAKDFKDRYRTVDLLLIDDIQFLATKEQTQDEFFHTFNHLHQNKKQVVLASDRPPKEIKGLEVRLQTRFEGGMVCDISQPDLETREAILRQKAKKMEYKVDNEIITFIAENVTASIRELEGALNKVVAACELSNSPVTLEKAQETLGAIASNNRKVITPDLVIKEVHKYYRIPIEEILGRKRTKELVLPRQITMYLLRALCDLSFPEIGREMGGKDHSTIMHGCEKIVNTINTNSRIKEDIVHIKEMIFSVY